MHSSVLVDLIVYPGKGRGAKEQSKIISGSKTARRPFPKIDETKILSNENWPIFLNPVVKPRYVIRALKFECASA